MIKYAELGTDKRLCDVVFAGSHDAGITKGGAATRAQRDTIEQQAMHGARFFDVRIAAFQGGGKVKMKTFHADEILQFNKNKTVQLKDRNSGDKLAKQKMEIMRLPVGGNSGEQLHSILNGAKKFLSGEGQGEFLVLIFSKSTNMDLVVSEIDAVLGDFQYGAPGNLNIRTLRELAGRVVCVYAEKDDVNLQLDSYKHHAFGAKGPRFEMKNLFKEGTYKQTFNGIQYFGKGGLTRDLSGEKKKIDNNARLQAEKMGAAKGMQGCEELLGMVYVTATGGIGSIKNRDKKLWKDKRIAPLLDIWENDDVVDNLTTRMPSSIDGTAQSSAPVIKQFFPNIVMMDFTDARRCYTIYNINTHAPGSLADRSLSRPKAPTGRASQGAQTI